MPSGVFGYTSLSLSLSSVLPFFLSFSLSFASFSLLVSFFLISSFLIFLFVCVLNFYRYGAAAVEGVCAFLSCDEAFLHYVQCHFLRVPLRRRFSSSKKARQNCGGEGERRDHEGDREKKRVRKGKREQETRGQGDKEEASLTPTGNADRGGERILSRHSGNLDRGSLPPDGESSSSSSSSSWIAEDIDGARLFKSEIPIRYDDEEEEFFFLSSTSEVEEEEGVAEIDSLNSQLLSDHDIMRRRDGRQPSSRFPVPFSSFSFIHSPLFPALKRISRRGEKKRRKRRTPGANSSSRLHAAGPIPCCCSHSSPHSSEEEEEEAADRRRRRKGRRTRGRQETKTGKKTGGLSLEEKSSKRKKKKKRGCHSSLETLRPCSSSSSSSCACILQCDLVKSLPPPLPLSLHRFVPPQCLLVTHSLDDLEGLASREEERRRSDSSRRGRRRRKRQGGESSPSSSSSSGSRRRRGRKKKTSSFSFSSSSSSYRNLMNVSFQTRDLLRRSYTVYDFFLTAFSEGLPAFFRNDCPLSCIPSCTFHDWCYRRPRPSLTPGKSSVFFPNPPSPPSRSEGRDDEEERHQPQGSGGVQLDQHEASHRQSSAYHPSYHHGRDGMGGEGGYALPGEAPPGVLFCQFLDAFSGLATACICRGLHPATCSRASNVYHIVKVLELFLFSRSGSLEQLPAHITTDIPKRWRKTLSFALLPSSSSPLEERKKKREKEEHDEQDHQHKEGEKEREGGDNDDDGRQKDRLEGGGQQKNGERREEEAEAREKDAVMEELGDEEATRREEGRLEGAHSNASQKEESGWSEEGRRGRSTGDKDHHSRRARIHHGEVSTTPRSIGQGETCMEEEEEENKKNKNKKEGQHQGEEEEEEDEGPPLLSLGLVMTHLLLSIQHPASQELLLRLLGKVKKLSSLLLIFLCPLSPSFSLLSFFRLLPCASTHTSPIPSLNPPCSFSVLALSRLLLSAVCVYT